MIDSSVGGKTGINHSNTVNLIGTYYNPKAVYMDPAILLTLHERDYLAGICEAIKMSITTQPSLFFDESFKTMLGVKERDPESLCNIVVNSVKSKLFHVSDDMHEQGSRLILNYGHTFGQALESFYGINHDALRHGEAVSLGIVCAANLANNLYRTPASRELPARVIQLLRDIGLPISLKNLDLNEFPTSKALLNILSFDKKRIASGNRFVLCRGFGQSEIVHVSDDNELIKAFEAIL